MTRRPLSAPLFGLLSLVAACAAPDSGTDSAAKDADTAADTAAGARPAADADAVRAPPEDTSPAIAPPAECGEHLQVLRVSPWAGRGLQVTAVADPQEGLSLADITLLDANQKPLDIALAPVPTGPGITGIAIIPSADPAVMAARQAAARAFIQAMPPDERFALWRDDGPLLSDLTADRAHLSERIDALGPESVSVSDRAAIRDALGAVGHGLGAIHRTLVVVGANQSAAAPGSVWVVPLSGEPDAGQVLAQRLLDRRANTLRLGTCAPIAAESPLTLVFGDLRCPLAVPAPWEHLDKLTCDPEAAAHDQYPYGDEIEFHLTVEQQTTWDAYHSDPKNKDDIPLAISIGPSAPLPGTAHLRGQSSLGCQRVSYTVNLAGGSPVRLQPGAADDRFHLISLCLDDHYFRLMLSNRLMAPLGVYPLDARFVRLRVNGQNQGVYMMIEHVRDTLVAERAATAAILRRRFDPEDHPEDVKYPKDPALAEAALADYKALTARVDTDTGEPLYQAIRERLDLGGYLRWLALMTFLKNGDYVDEAYFYASVEAGQLYWRSLGWDSDDLMQACHHGGKWALDDPNGLVTCAEADLDRILVHSEPAYRAWVETLEALMHEGGAKDALGATLGTVRVALFALLDNETATAMVEVGLQNPTATTIQESIQDNMTAFEAAVDSRRLELETGIATWKAAHP